VDGWVCTFDSIGLGVAKKGNGWATVILAFLGVNNGLSSALVV